MIGYVKLYEIGCMATINVVSEGNILADKSFPKGGNVWSFVANEKSGGVYSG
jgi:hypothetical protein